MSDGSRRFTDREVALVLKKASEIEESTGSGISGGARFDRLDEQRSLQQHSGGDHTAER
ncbi:MAG: hypothetical protein O2992_03945 [Gemmatimonadetes bacterium]|jgi:hypothetical protein|nr:hypothetical protein [Gemmatimonadota bacterium]